MKNFHLHETIQKINQNTRNYFVIVFHFTIKHGLHTPETALSNYLSTNLSVTMATAQTSGIINFLRYSSTQLFLFTVNAWLRSSDKINGAEEKIFLHKYSQGIEMVLYLKIRKKTGHIRMTF